MSASVSDDDPSAPAADRLAPAPIKVLLIDGHRLLAEALAIVLAADAEIEVVGVQADAAVSAAGVRRAAPDVLVVDAARWEEIAAILAELRAELAQLKVIVLAAAPDDEALLTFVRAGVAGQVGTDRSPAELIRAVKQVHAGEVLFAPNLLVELLQRSQRRPPEPLSRSALRPLAPRELEIVELLARGMTIAKVAERLDITANTVRSHLKKAMGKLGASSRLETVIVALKSGLIELPD